MKHIGHLKQEKSPYNMFAIVSPKTNSLIDKHHKITYKDSIVSFVIAPGSNHPDHAFIIVEGMNARGELILHRYDLSLIDKYGNYVKSDYATVIVAPKICTQLQNHYDELYKLLHKHDPKRVDGLSWRISREEAKLLDRNIKEEVGKLQKFSIYGKQSIVGRGHNCYTWAREQLLKLHNPAIDKVLPVRKEDYLITLPRLHLNKKPDNDAEQEKFYTYTY